MLARLVLLFGCVAIASAQPGLDRPLPARFNAAQDIRWVSDRSVLISAGRAGVYELPIDTVSAEPRLILAGGDKPGGFFFASRLAVTPDAVVTSAPLGSLVIRRRRDTSALVTVPLSVVVDVDARQDRIVILGANRDDAGRWSPDGAIAWFGSLSSNLKDLRPIRFSQAGPGSKPMALCHFLESGGVRFAPDGTFVVVPGVEPGVSLYNADGGLQRTWDTSSLGYDDRCSLSIEQFKVLSSSGPARTQWVNAHRVIDDVVFVSGKPALIIRSWDGKTTHWRLMTLLADGTSTSTTLPFVSRSRDAHLRADVNRSRWAVLMFDFLERPESTPQRPNRLIVRTIKP